MALSAVRRLSVLSGHVRHASSGAGGRYDYDLVVIGGGSGGLACSKEAARLGKKVAVLDFVTPSPQGSVWGLGGTCVNVGCIPKKLMHQAALLGQSLKDARSYGWSLPTDISHSWSSLRDAVVAHIKSLNWGHRVQLKEKSVDYFNARASFLKPHAIEAVTKDGTKSRLSAEHFVLAVGGRPKYPENVEGAERFGITSDDLFFLEKPPGKTLVVGASYVALECAGFLAGLGCPTSLLIRSAPLKQFDQDVASLVVDHLERECGVRMVKQCTPLSVRGCEGGEGVTVTWRHADSQTVETEEFDTVLFATGRVPSTAGLNLSAVGVKLDAAGRVVVDQRECTSVPHIFAIGDAINVRWELTPVAVKAGKMLAQRLFSENTPTALMNYNLVPTTVFTPLELAAVGLTENQALQLHSELNVEVYHAFYKPLEYYLPARNASYCYIKMVCVREGKEEGGGGEERVVGLHLSGPNAGEVLQGFALAISCGATRRDFERQLCIHPTSAEEVIKLHATKRSGEDPTISAC